MSADERMALLDAAIAGGVPTTRMMPGTGACSINEAAKVSAHATKHGVAGVLMLPPFYYKGVPEEGLFRFFSEVVQRVDCWLPVVAKPQAKLSDKCATGRSSESPETFARHAAALAKAGACAIGGCCGVGPAGIAALKAALAKEVHQWAS